MSCVGCGLFDPDDGVNPVRVNTSGTFGGAGLNFGGDDTVGAPIYCDETGRLRGPPEHDSSTETASSTVADGSGFNNSIVDGGTETITLTNPSALRSCSYLVVYFVKMSVLVTTTGFAFRVQVNVDGGGLATRQAEYWGVPAGESYSVEQILFDSISGSLAAGGAVDIDIVPGIDGTVGAGAGTLVTQVVRADWILVTKAT